MGQSQTKQVSGELERLLLELRRELVEEEGETAADIDSFSQRVGPLRSAGMSEQLVLDLYIRDIHDEFSE